MEAVSSARKVSVENNPEFLAMRKRVGVATSVVLTGGMYAQGLSSPDDSYLFPEEGTVYLWVVAITAVVTYWLGYGLAAGVEWLRSGSRPASVAEPEYPTTTSQVFSRRPSTPQTGSRLAPNRSRAASSDSQGLSRVQGRTSGTTQDQSGPDSADGWISKLERLSDLRERGSLTDDEFASLKHSLLPETSAAELGELATQSSPAPAFNPRSDSSKPATTPETRPKVKRSKRTVVTKKIQKGMIKPEMRRACQELAARDLEVFDGQVKLHFPPSFGTHDSSR